jgi:cell wall-associated NlpC family hydrolase
MMKKILAIAAMTSVLTTCGISASAEEEVTKPAVEEVAEEVDHQTFIEFLIDFDIEKTLLQKQAAEFEQAQLRASKMETRISALEQYVNKTWYVFSGITPDGWDCSGLVMWYYSELGVKLEHSVTAQMHSGKNPENPMPGDIVAFKYNGSKIGYHNGIYVGNDMYIHAPKKGTRTKLSSVSEYAGKHSVPVYTRIDLGLLK